MDKLLPQNLIRLFHTCKYTNHRRKPEINCLLQEMDFVIAVNSVLRGLLYCTQTSIQNVENNNTNEKCGEKEKGHWVYSQVNFPIKIYF